MMKEELEIRKGQRAVRQKDRRIKRFEGQMSEIGNGYHRIACPLEIEYITTIWYA